jgi:hypothetical protein
VLVSFPIITTLNKFFFFCFVPFLL